MMVESLIKVGNTQSTCQSNPWLPFRYRHKWYHYFNRICVFLPWEQGKAQTLSRDQNIIKNWKWAVLTWSSKPAPITIRTPTTYSNHLQICKNNIVLSDTGKSLSLSLYINPRATFYNVLPSSDFFFFFVFPPSFLNVTSH